MMKNTVRGQEKRKLLIGNNSKKSRYLKTIQIQRTEQQCLESLLSLFLALNELIQMVKTISLSNLFKLKLGFRFQNSNTFWMSSNESF